MFQRAPTPNDTLRSVVVDEKGYVTFSIYAPEAENVTVSGDMGRNELSQDDIGVWSVTMTNIKPGVYRYSFTVDGVTAMDPKSQTVTENRPLLEVPGEGADFWAMKDVPHGAVSRVWYPSSTLNTTRRMHIYIPPGYEKSDETLPVLYLLHGGGDNDNAWPNVGRAGFIMDNLISEGLAERMIVVMPDGSIDTKVFAEDLKNNIIPYIESNYNVYTDADHRALAGLSMGGLEVLDAFMAYPEMFAYINVMSSGWFANNEEMYEEGDKRLEEIAPVLSETVKYLIFTQGGPEDIAYNNGKEMLKVFDKHNIKYEFSEMPGGHSWYVWRNDLLNFAQKAFK